MTVERYDACCLFFYHEVFEDTTGGIIIIEVRRGEPSAKNRKAVVRRYAAR